MPNHITNLVTFGTNDAAKAAFQQMLQDMRADDKPLGSFDFNKLLPMPKELNIESGSRTDKGLNRYKTYRAKRDTILKASPFISEAGLNLPDEKIQEILLAGDPITLRQLQALDNETASIRQDDPKTWELGRKAYENIQKYGHPTWYEWCIDNWGTKWNAYGYDDVPPYADTLSFLTAWSAVPNLIKLLSQKYPDQTITYSWADEDTGSNVGEIVMKNGDVISVHVPEDNTKDAYEMSARIRDIDLADYGYRLTEDGANYEYVGT